ncbi:hypothetical protein HG530_009295 [Fusarium avenaceum]|nr:hypothetical protein HG530_009295 [Fusarium avenaceum]
MTEVGLALAVVVRTAQSANIEEGITLLVGLALDGSHGGRGGRLRCPSDDNSFGSGSGLESRSNLGWRGSLGSCGGLESSGILSGRGGLGSQGEEGGEIGGEIDGTGGENGRGGERGLSSGGDRSRGSR